MSVCVPFASDAVAVGVGAVCGALCRHYVGKGANANISANPQQFGHLTCWHTASINVLGSFVLGGIFGSPVIDSQTIAKGLPGPDKVANTLSSTRFGLTPRAKLALSVGFCGSFTTFSTYSVDVITMMSKGEICKAASYVAVNNIGGFLAAAAGLTISRRIFGM